MAFITGAAIMGGAGLLGGYMQGKSAKAAANIQAQSQRDAANIAAEAAKFRPVGTTTRFGTSQFTYSPEGYVTGAGYNVSPELQAYQDRLMALQGGALTGAENAPSMFAPFQTAGTNALNLANQYIGQSPDEVAAEYMANQQALLAPSRDVESARLSNQLFNTGRGGLSVAQGGNLGAANPEQQALANARAMQDLQIAANARTAGQQNVLFGTGLANTAGGLFGQYNTGLVNSLSPYNAYLSGAQTIEGLGQNALDIGMNIGAKGMSPTAANALWQGGNAAAQSQYSANAYNPYATALQGAASNPALTNGLANWWSGGGGAGGGGALDTSKYGYGDYGFNAAQNDIYGRG